MKSIKEGTEATYTNPVSNIKQKVMIITLNSTDTVTVIPIDSVDPNEHFFCSTQELSLK
ncbi:MULTISPECIES: hypothetical protein [unclassified Tenacibaculum]|uniref:hypothetical protein n=1 Tax=unclassified Tenacibaculum TaxID=2635139 RepID=UPI001F43F454|nr:MULTISPECIES: hypothetical protein [unclassified Tenacibaculum]MCF2874045.1 hypothetical protein [Tenacibaculum sp. Cn5-1]MCF2934627.1 hypothetical protein [Tenacibaculum sp. Cn5-34]MCG7510837.1 hypothetical protein [Tenacibaculum sp. Cn5-46]